MSALSVYDLLNRKRRGEALASREIAELVRLFVEGKVADYQMTAFLMAVAIRGMTAGELAALTRAMLESGEQWELHERFDFIADKHSTGGVGDKVSIVLAPWVAACGVKIAMLSGRGLGHTGGTLDKLDAIPGFSARLTREEMERCIHEAGCAIATSTQRIAPADRRTYALRDVTGTVESIPLITASIMSKKLAMGASALLLDVKTGRGAFMKTLDESRALARSLIDAAAGTATRVEAFITDMDAPLGLAVGNASEIAESFEVLRGNGPRDLHDVTRALVIRILVLSGKFDEPAAEKAADHAIRSGAALANARKWIEAQRGHAEVVDRPELLPRPSAVVDVRSLRSGFVVSIDTLAAGMLAVDLGAGRHRQEDEIDPAVGLRFTRKPGDAVSAGDVLGRIEFGSRPFDRDATIPRFRALFEIGDAPPEPRPLVIERVV